MSVGDDVPPQLESPATLVQSLFEKVQVDGVAEEVVYLDSNVLDHRWGADTFRDIGEEFEYKAVWVAKQLRDLLGAPEHTAYLRVLERLTTGPRAAAWWKRGLVVYVSLRHEMNQHSASLERHHFTVMVGVADPSPEDKGPGGDEARLAAGIAPLIH